MTSINDQSARDFLEEHFATHKEFLNIDLARLGLLMEFFNKVLPKLEISNNGELNVAIVSGSHRDPEVMFLLEKCNVEVLNYEDDKKFDLHKDWGAPEFDSLRSRYDIVLCHQVLEHVQDPKLAFDNLSKLVKNEGFIYVNVPGINNIHCDPYYFYAGFHPRTLSYFATEAKLKVINAGGIYSRKVSKMYATCDWIACKYSLGLRFSLLMGLRTRNLKELLKALKYGVKAKLKYPNKAAMSTSGDYLCAAWILAKKT